jgi:dTDP-4-amino-4,6-dideoxygalactose transaminase
MQFIDLAAQQKQIRIQLDENINTVLEHGKYIMGPEVSSLEQRLAEYVGVKHAIACSSGTDALLMALMAYDIGPGDVIFTTPFTFIATAEVISLLGAVPVFAEIDPETFNIAPAHLDSAIKAVRANNTSIYPLPDTKNNTPLNPKGIIAVDLFGLPADYENINSIAKDHDLFVIEDAAQSFGGEYHGKKACSLGNIACTSFFPAKPLGCYGDGGMCFTDSDQSADSMRSLRVHGKGFHKYDNAIIGINGRLDTLQAAILHAKFDIFPEEIESRQQVANTYDQLISEPEIKLKIPHIPLNYVSAWAQYSILAIDNDHRTSIQACLKNEDIPTAIYYPKPLHMQTAFGYLGYREGDFLISEDYAKRIFSLPMHPYLKQAEQEKIVKAMKGKR